MKTRLSILLFSCLLPLGMMAQGVFPVKVSSERSSQGDVTIYADNESYMPYTVSLVFSKLEGSNSFIPGETHLETAHRGRTRLITLKRSSPNAPMSYSYKTSMRQGDCHAKTDTTFVYLLPLMKGKQTKIGKLVSLDKFMKQTEKGKVTGVSFDTNENDTIVAARKGLVVIVRDKTTSEGENRAFAATVNHVTILHEDGSMASYKLFRSEKIFVSPGDEVIPGQPLGLIDGSNYSRGSHLRFSIFCPDIPNDSFIPVFHLSADKTDKPEMNKLYTTEHPQEIITQEMSKKEKKKYLKAILGE